MKPVHSMTGFSSAEKVNGNTTLRLEFKALNHRFLDVRIRMPREFSSAEMPLRNTLQKRFSRGSIDVKLEKVTASGDTAATPSIDVDLELAHAYYQALESIQKKLGLKEPVRATEIASFPEVIRRGSSEMQSDEAWAVLEPLARDAIGRLEEMRAHEGQALGRLLLSDMKELEESLAFLRRRRAECQDAYRQKITERITGIFENHPLPEGPLSEASTRALIEGRIAQELALALDRTDIEEELNRFDGHVSHFRKILSEGGPVGRKLDFILQEMHREINTLGNKAQDLPISEQVVQLKVKLEQIREQVMNLE